jgi:hypothetical protein
VLHLLFALHVTFEAVTSLQKHHCKLVIFRSACCFCIHRDFEKKLFRSFLFACSNARTNYLVLQKHHCKLKVLNEFRVHPSNKSTTALATKAPLLQHYWVRDLVLQKHHYKLKVLNEFRVHPINKSTTAAAQLGKRELMQMFITSITSKDHKMQSMSKPQKNQHLLMTRP